MSIKLNKSCSVLHNPTMFPVIVMLFCWLLRIHLIDIISGSSSNNRLNLLHVVPLNHISLGYRFTEDFIICLRSKHNIFRGLILTLFAASFWWPNAYPVWKFKLFSKIRFSGLCHLLQGFNPLFSMPLC